MKSKFLLILGCAGLLFAAASVVAESTKKEDVKKEDGKAPLEQAVGEAKRAKSNTPVALSMEAIQELEERKAQLDTREKELAEKAKALEVQEKVLKDKLKRMEELNKKMAEKLDKFKAEFEQKVVKLVTVVESMRPQAAAEYVENLDADLAVEILARIQVAKAAKIMNLVDKKKSARLTELYTGYRDSIDETKTVPSEIKETSKDTGKENIQNNAKM